jgi:hypothetical protein
VEVWDPRDKPTVLSQIKKAIEARTGHLKGWVVCLYPGILLILILFLLMGCVGMKWPWQKEEVVQLNPLVLPPDDLTDTQNTIACIKLQPECIVDQRN